MRFAIVPAVLAGIGLLVCAQDAPKERTKGTVLLLKTGHAMEGDIERTGMQFCIRRGPSEVWIAEDRAIRLCADWADAFAFALTKINTNDADDRIRLARWCHLHHLNDRALEQARCALELQPTNAEAKQFVLMLERSLREPAPKSVAPTPIRAQRPADSAPAVDVSFDTQISFATKVQPILVNRCATCHSNGNGSKFQLDRGGDNVRSAATQRNLAAVLEYVDLDRPAISPLLVKSVTRHGDAQVAPIKDRSAAPLQSMQQWIVETIAKNPQLKDYRNAKKPKTEGPSPEPKSAFPTQRSAAPAPAVEVVLQTSPRLQPTPTPVQQRDWYHPDHFNEHFHPEVFRPQSASSR
ncbi:MAG: hypothetical protein HY289_04225 [Planctomycetes bacterium]|nr:hypothetical protein [Planctomycetota bacterium]